MAGPIPATQTYFNEARVQEAFAGLPRRYHNIETGDDRLRIANQVTMIYKRRRKLGAPGAELYRQLCDIHEKCWIAWDRPEAENRTVRRIGIWGQIWALAVVWSLISREQAKLFTVPQLAADIVKFGREEGILNSDTFRHELAGEEETGTQAEKDRERARKASILRLLSVDFDDLIPTNYKDLLQTYLRRGDDPSIIPSLPASEAVRRCFVEYLLVHLNKSAAFFPEHTVSADDLIRLLEEVDYTSPEECFRGIVDELGLREKVEARERDLNNLPKQTGLSWLEPSVWRYITSHESDKRSAPPEDVEQKRLDITKLLDYRGVAGTMEKPMAILSGPAHSGKKSILGDFFKSLKRGREVVFSCRGRTEEQRSLNLPVLCIQTRDRDYVSLCVEVLVFLERNAFANANKKANVPSQDEALGKRWVELDQNDGAPSLQSLLTRIRDLHRKAPAFFVFMDVRATSYTDIRSLIRRHGIGRLVETLFRSNADSRFLLTTESADDQFAKFSHRNFPLDPPTFARLAWYFSDDQEDEFTRVAEAHDFEALRDTPISGDVLMALSILFSQNDVQHDEFFKMLKTLAIGKKDDAEPPVDFVCRRLVESWRADKLIPIIALIAAASDGMMSETLRACITEWKLAFEGLDVADHDTIIAKLQDLKKLGRGLFLRFQPPTDFLSEELRFDEPMIKEGDEYYWTWEFDAGFAKVLLRILASDEAHAQVLRQAYRLVSIQARIRAQHRQLRGLTGQRSFGQQVPERSVQAFIALLLSLPPSATGLADDTAAAARPDVLKVVHSASAVFTLTEFNQAAAIRYAYHVLLRAEADYDDRLSMSLDTDLLRLQLYTLLCANPGSVLSWNGDRLKQRRHELPRELSEANLDHLKVFPIRIRSQILTSLGMAAFYSGYFPILLWADGKIGELATEDEDVADDHSRLIAARVDLECQIGFPLREALTAQGETKLADILPHGGNNLSKVKSLLAQDIVRLTKIASKTGSKDETSAIRRLNIRMDYLSALISPKGSAADLQPADKPSAIQGRTARLWLKTKLHQFPLLSERSGTGWTLPYDRALILAAADKILDANILRLSRYSGSERALTMIDYARKLMMQGHVGAALGAIESARGICFLGASGDSVRLEVLYLETSILIAHAEVEHARRSMPQGKLQGIADDISVNLDYIDDIIRAHHFHFEKSMQHALGWRAQTMAKTTGTKVKLRHKAPLPEAIKIATEAGALGLKQDLERIRDAIDPPRAKKRTVE